MYDEDVKTAGEENRVDHYWRGVFKLTMQLGTSSTHICKGG